MHLVGFITRIYHDVRSAERQIKIIPDHSSKKVHIIYYNCTTVNSTTVHKYMTLLLHVSAYNGHIQAGGCQREITFWLITLYMCIYKPNILTLNKLHDKSFETWDRLRVLIFNFLNANKPSTLYVSILLFRICPSLDMTV